MSIRFLNLPATEAWKEMMKEKKTSKFQVASGKELDIEELKIIYKLNADRKSAVLYDFYEEGMKFDGEGIVVPLSSTFASKETYNRGTRFVNVIGSSNDTLGYRSSCSWIALYEFITGHLVTHCYTDGLLYHNDSNFYNELICNPAEYNENIQGGHVIIGNRYENPNIPDEHDLVGIVPICPSHNHYLRTGYMQLGYETEVVVLNYIMNNI